MDNEQHRSNTKTSKTTIIYHLYPEVLQVLWSMEIINITGIVFSVQGWNSCCFVCACVRVCMCVCVCEGRAGLPTILSSCGGPQTGSAGWINSLCRWGIVPQNLSLERISHAQLWNRDRGGLKQWPLYRKAWVFALLLKKNAVKRVGKKWMSAPSPPLPPTLQHTNHAPALPSLTYF